MSWLLTLSPEAGAVLIAVGVIVIFATLAWIFERFFDRHPDLHVEQARRDVERMIAAANAEVITRPRVRAGQLPTQQEKS